MKIKKHKGKVHPSPSSSSLPPLPPSPSSESAFSVLNRLLPAAILVLTVILAPEDQEVLAYMVLHSKKIFSDSKTKKKGDKKPTLRNHPAHLKCGCFDCYTHFWFRWNNSPNRERIHQVIDAFEDHLSSGEGCSSSKKPPKGKKTEKSPQKPEKECKSGYLLPPETLELEEFPPEKEKVCVLVKGEERQRGAMGKSGAGSPGTVRSTAATSEIGSPASSGERGIAAASGEKGAAAAARGEKRLAAASSHKGLARKVLPDVLGLLNSRLWSLWSPNV